MAVKVLPEDIAMANKLQNCGVDCLAKALASYIRGNRALTTNYLKEFTRCEAELIELEIKHNEVMAMLKRLDELGYAALITPLNKNMEDFTHERNY